MDEEIQETDVSNIIEEVKLINEENDIFDTYSKAKSICEFLELDANKKILEKNNLIAIYGSWGTGKSCLMKTIQANLDNNKFETLWFDTWKNENDDNLPYSLLKFIGEKNDFWGDLKTTLVDAGGVLYGLFKSFTKSIEIDLNGTVIKPGEFVQSLEETTKEMDQNIEDEMCLWEKVQWFEEEFKKIQVANDSQKRLVVFLDDLDRCESENIITLMSSIKLLLSTNPNIIFILGIDKNAVKLALKNKYSNDENKADEYLEKIFPITFEITNKFKIENFKKYISNITTLNVDDSQFVVDFFYKLDFTNSRHIKKVFRKYYFVKEYLKFNGYDLTNKFNVVFVLYNIILNIFYNDEYQYLLSENPEEKYKGLISYTNTDSGRKEYPFYPSTIKGHLKGTPYNEYKRGVAELWLKISSYKIKNQYIRGTRAIDYSDWQAVFENNICNRFLDFIIKNEGFLNEFLKQDDEKSLKKEEIEMFINRINLVM